MERPKKFSPEDVYGQRHRRRSVLRRTPALLAVAGTILAALIAGCEQDKRPTLVRGTWTREAPFGYSQANPAVEDSIAASLGIRPPYRLLEIGRGYARFTGSPGETLSLCMEERSVGPYVDADVEAQPQVPALYVNAVDPLDPAAREVEAGSLEERGTILLLRRYAEWDLPPIFHQGLVAMIRARGVDARARRWFENKLTREEREAMECLLLAGRIEQRDGAPLGSR